MANVTIHEFNELPDSNGDMSWPAYKDPTTILSSATHTLSDATRYVIITADADCRVSFTSAGAVTSGMVIMSACDNPFKLRNGKSRTLKFL